MDNMQHKVAECKFGAKISNYKGEVVGALTSNNLEVLMAQAEAIIKIDNDANHYCGGGLVVSWSQTSCGNEEKEIGRFYFLATPSGLRQGHVGLTAYITWREVFNNEN